MRVFAIRRDTSGTISIHYDFGVLESYTSGAVGRKPWPQATLDRCSIQARMQDFNFSYRRFAIDRYNGGILESQQLTPSCPTKNYDERSKSSRFSIAFV